MDEKPGGGTTEHIRVPGKKSSATSVVQLPVKESRDEPIEERPEGKGTTQSGTDAAGTKALPCSLHQLFQLILGQNGKAYAVFHDKVNPYALTVGSRQLDLRIRQFVQSQGERLKKSEASQINDDLQAEAELAGEVTQVFHRVAPVSDGIEIDIGDELHTRVRITAGKVEVLKNE